MRVNLVGERQGICLFQKITNRFALIHRKRIDSHSSYSPKTRKLQLDAEIDAMKLPSKRDKPGSFDYAMALHAIAPLRMTQR